MSSSRDQNSLIGVPGICLAIAPPGAHSRSCRAGQNRRRASACERRIWRRAGRKPPAWRRTRPRRSACRSRPRTCPACRARWRSSAPSRRGSGRDSCRPPRPSWRRRDRGFGVAVLVADEGRLRLSSPSASHFAIESLETLALSPSSQTIGSASSAVLACHQVSATTATVLSSTRTTFLTPFMPMTLAASKLFSLPPKTGQSLIAAFSMPGSLTSMP